MSVKEVYYEDFNNLKGDNVLNKLIKQVKNNKSDYIYILPNQNLINEVKNKILENTNGLFDFKAYTFDNIVDNLVKKLPYKTITKPLKNIIIKDIILKLNKDGKLEYYKDICNLEGFILSISDNIGLVKRSLIYPDELIKNTRNKLEYFEIALIYKEYEDFLEQNKLIDLEGKYFKAIEELNKSGKKLSFLKDMKHIYINQFNEFRPIEIELIKNISKTNINITILMPFKMDYKNDITNKTISTLKELGFKIINSKENIKQSSDILSRRLFNEKLFENNINANLKLITAATPYLETKGVFKDIRTKARSGSCNFSDFNLVVPNDDYLQEVYRVSEEENVPLNYERKIKISEVPVVLDILTILKSRIDNYSYNSLINRMKCEYISIVDSSFDRDFYENILRSKLRFKDLDDLSKKIKENIELEMKENELLNVINIIDELEEERNLLKTHNTVEEYNNILMKILNDYNIFDRIFKNYNNNEDNYILLRDFESINKIYEIFELMSNNYLKDRNVSIEEYYFILNQYLEDDYIKLSKHNKNGVKILSPNNGRGITSLYTYVLGLSQGSYPDIEMNYNYLINQYNYNDLLKLGFKIKDYKQNLDIEILNFASSIANTKKKIILSYSKGKDDSQIPSVFLEEIFKIVNKIDVKEFYMDYYINNEDMITTSKEYILNNLNKMRENNKLIESFMKNNDNLIVNITNKNKGEYCRKNGIINNYSGVLKDYNITKDERRSIKYSPTQINVYSNCPYNYYLSYILKIEEISRKYEEYNLLNLGTAYHNILYQYYYNNKNNINNILLNNLSFDKLNKNDLIYLDRIIDYNLEKEKISLDNKVLKNDMMNKIKKFIIKDIEYMKKHRLEIVDLEKKFGYDENFILKSNDRTVKLYGRVDRINKHISEDKYVLVDYKLGSSSKESIDSIENLKSFQLPIYILSESRNIIAAGYQIINSSKMDIIIGKKKSSSILARKRKGVYSEEEWKFLFNQIKAEIIKIIEEIESGDFQVNPRKCPEYCEYKNVCRYNKEVDM